MTKKNPAALPLLAALTALVALASCGGGGGGSSPPPVSPPTAPAPPPPAPPPPAPPGSGSGLLTGASCTAEGQRGWCLLAPARVGRQVHAVHCDSASRCMAVGERGYVALTQDGGLSWTRQDAPTGGADFVQVVTAGGDTVYAGSRLGTEFWRSADGGRSWTLASAPTTPLGANAFAAPLRLWALDRDTVVTAGGTQSWISSDGARSWRALPFQVGAVGSDGSLWSGLGNHLSTDRGATVRELWPNSDLRGVLARSIGPGGRMRLVTGVGNQLESWRSDDGGATFSRTPAVSPPMPAQGRVIDAVLRDDGRGHLLVGATQAQLEGPPLLTQAQLWATVDEGRTWTLSRSLSTGSATLGFELANAGFVDGRWLHLRVIDLSRMPVGSFYTPTVLELDSGTLTTMSPLAGASLRPTSLLRMAGGPWLSSDHTGSWWQSVDMGTTWTRLPESEAPPDPWLAGLRAPLAIDDQRLLAVTTTGGSGALEGGVLRSVDGGRGWAPTGAPQDVITGLALETLPDGSVHLHGGARPWRSTDGGLSWVSWPLPERATFGARFVDADFGWAYRSDCAAPNVCTGELLVTADGGRRWDTVATVNDTFHDVVFIDRQRAIGHGRGWPLRHSGDGGRTWATATVTDATGQAAQATPTATPRFDRSGTGWAVADIGGRAGVLRSRDGGRSWQGLSLPLPADWPAQARLTAIHSLDGVRVWAVGDRGTVLASRDGGATWRLQPSGTRAALSGVHVVDEQTVWMVASEGLTLVTQTGGE